MAFPVVESVERHFSTNNTTQKILHIPAVVQSGWLLLGLISQEVNSSFNNVAAGWTEIRGGSVNNHIVAKVADGTEGGGTATFTTISAFGYSAHCYAISNWVGNLSGIASSHVDSGGAAEVNPDSPSLTPPWGALDTLWISFVSHKATVTVSDGPDGFSVPIADSNTSSGTTETCISCTDDDNIATKDPTEYTVSVAATWAASTIAIQPLGASLVIRGLAYNPIKDELYWITSTPEVRKVSNASSAPAVAWQASIELLATPAITTPSGGQILTAIVN